MPANDEGFGTSTKRRARHAQGAGRCPETDAERSGCPKPSPTLAPSLPRPHRLTDHPAATMGDKRSNQRGRSSGRPQNIPPPPPEKVPLMPATALAAMRYADLTQPPKRIPEITVRKPVVTPCSEPLPCVGVRDRRHSCGPSPPTSKESFTPCGLPQCFNEDICTCRCYCGLRREMMRAEDEGHVPTMGVISELLPRSGSMGKVHVARIHGLEPREPLLQPRYGAVKQRRRDGDVTQP